MSYSYPGMILYRFSAPSGIFILQLTDGSSISRVGNSFIRLLPAKMVDYDKYFIEVRESQPVFFVLIGIVLIVRLGYA